MIYLNEFDPTATAWLRQLMWAGLIPLGEVDARDIREVGPDDVQGTPQCHWFAGIGGWCEALRLAGWPPNRPVWTASCPCQPFSSAGRRRGTADARHLWPELFRLVRECRPPVVFGEQVASADGYRWLAGVQADLEGAGYAIGRADLPAGGFGSPHRRQRLFWVADADGRQPGDGQLQPGGQHGQQPADSGAGSTDALADPRGEREPGDQRRPGQGGQPVTPGASRVGQSKGERHETPVPLLPGGAGRVEQGRRPEVSGDAGFWAAYDLIPCRDGKARRAEPGVRPLAHGVPGRVGLLRGYGNAIVPQVAAAFITAYLQAASDRFVTEG